MAHEAKILSLIARGPEGRTPHEAVVHETPDISEYLDFDFYDPIWYLDRPSSPNNVKIGRWLGVAHRIGSSLCYWILTATGKVIARTTVQHVTQEDLSDTQKKAQLESFDNSVREFLDNESHRVQPSEENGFLSKDIDLSDQDDTTEQAGTNAEEADDYTPDAYDNYLGAQLLLPQGGPHQCQGYQRTP